MVGSLYASIGTHKPMTNYLNYDRAKVKAKCLSHLHAKLGTSNLNPTTSDLRLTTRV